MCILQFSMIQRFSRILTPFCSFIGTQRVNFSKNIKLHDLEKSVNHDKTTQKNVAGLDKALCHEKQPEKQKLDEVNEARIAEIMEYYSQYEKELSEGGYKDNDDMWLTESSNAEQPEKFPVSLDRGQEGVFDVHEMVEVSSICMHLVFVKKYTPKCRCWKIKEWQTFVA